MALHRTAATIVLCLQAAGGAANAFDAPPSPPAAAPDPAGAALREPWPDAETLRERRLASERRPLFETSDLLSFTLTANFGRVNKDRDPRTTRRHAAVLTVAGKDGQPRAIPVMLRPRGHFRRMSQNCPFVPLRVEFGDKGDVKGTPFEGQQALKLVTHCGPEDSYEQDRLQEYLGYRLLNLLTPRSFRARLARVTYVHSSSGKEEATRYAIFVEAERDVARRMEGRIVEVKRRLFRHMDPETLDVMMLFEYMIGNTDFSIHALHNVRLVQDRAGALHPIPYDLDMSGLVSAPYAHPDPRMGLRDVRGRRYRGPCRTEPQMQPRVAKFLGRKDEMMALVGSLEGLDREARRESKAYLEQFFSILERPASLKKLLEEGCKKDAAGM